MKKILLQKKYQTPQEVLKSLTKTKLKIAFVSEKSISVNQENAEKYITECNMPSNEYAVAVLFLDVKNVKKWLIATSDEINNKLTEVA